MSAKLFELRKENVKTYSQELYELKQKVIGDILAVTKGNISLLESEDDEENFRDL